SSEVSFGAGTGTAVWGDYDGDGYLDIMLSGADASTDLPATEIWRNNHDGTFSRAATLPIAGDTASADFMNNGHLGIFICGAGTNGLEGSFFQNYLSTNTPPAAPTGLTAAVTNSQVILNWNAPANAVSLFAGLTYNLRIGSTPGGSDIVSPGANSSTGFRLLPAFGNVDETLQYTNYSATLPGGVYYWSVQAVDGSFDGSPFGPESTFIIPDAAPEITGLASAAGAVTATLNAQVNPLDGDTYVFIQWGLTTNYDSMTPDEHFAGGEAFQPVSVMLTNLTPDTVYHWQVVAFNDFGDTRSPDQIFATASVASPLIESIKLSNGQAQMRFNGTYGLDYTLQESSNLMRWVDVTNLPAGSNGLFQFAVPVSMNPSSEFFRLKGP
ncbi:MAG TPA: VCBS repeat-containing protein, partial [Alphaproteobacteria bacterium]|nr:VCBS repeat-containing protein [Alphaproteobacteria bacterium]